MMRNVREEHVCAGGQEVLRAVGIDGAGRGGLRAVGMMAVKMVKYVAGKMMGKMHSDYYITGTLSAVPDLLQLK